MDWGLFWFEGTLLAGGADTISAANCVCFLVLSASIQRFHHLSRGDSSAFIGVTSATNPKAGLQALF